MSARTLVDVLRDNVEAYALIGAPALCERFVLRAGQFAYGAKLPIRFNLGPKKQCFRNATHLVWGHRELTYVEGYLMIANVEFPIHHAWASDAYGNVIDNTIRDPQAHQYMGVRFGRRQMDDVLAEAKTYGLFERDCGVINHALMESISPGVVAEARAVRTRTSKAEA